MVMVAKLPPLELHSGVAGIDFPRGEIELRRLGGQG